jgi:hypothetical protein
MGGSCELLAQCLAHGRPAKNAITGRYFHGHHTRFREKVGTCLCSCRQKTNLISKAHLPTVLIKCKIVYKADYLTADPENEA